MNNQDMIGKRYGRLIVISQASNNKNKTIEFDCICDCGNKCKANKYRLLNGQKQSCGCLHKEQLTERNKNTAKYKGESSTEYDRILRIYGAMKHRCYNKNDERYNDYGGRGIIICDEWLNDYFKFKEWALNNGYKDNLSIDRVNVNGNYEPSNCRWCTQKEQMNNTRVNKMLEYKGRTQTLSEWCDELKLNYFRVKARLNTCNMTVEQAFELPKQRLRRKINN